VFAAHIIRIGNLSQLDNSAWFGAKDIATFAEMIDFTAKPLSRAVQLNWTAISETDVLGYNIYRSQGANGQPEQINANIIAATGSPEITVSYSFVDKNVTNGIAYTYVLEEVENNGNTQNHGPVTVVPRWIYALYALLR